MSYKPFTKFSAAKSYFVQLINFNSNRGILDEGSINILMEYAQINEKDNLTAARFLIDNYNKIMISNAEVKIGV